KGESDRLPSLSSEQRDDRLDEGGALPSEIATDYRGDKAHLGDWHPQRVRDAGPLSEGGLGGGPNGDLTASVRLGNRRVRLSERLALARGAVCGLVRNHVWIAEG